MGMGVGMAIAMGMEMKMGMGIGARMGNGDGMGWDGEGCHGTAGEENAVTSGRSIAFDIPCGTLKWAPIGLDIPCTRHTEALEKAIPA